MTTGRRQVVREAERLFLAPPPVWKPWPSSCTELPRHAELSVDTSGVRNPFLVDADNRAVKTWGYRGTTTFGQLFKVSKPFKQMLSGRLNLKYSRITLHWGISTDLSGRPVIVKAIWRPGEGYPMKSVAVATRFSWNVKATAIKAPRAGGTAQDPYGDDVIDFFRS
ncbi:hypothetical protein AB0J63_25215 [Streptosporangium canum]|uniref:hypothetical protein n=1 Tax=Streptosporangium canum TaxID=324952 RepID=UPI00342E235C